MITQRCLAISGFSLSVTRNDARDFRWNWFSRQEPGFFAGKAGRVKVDLRERPHLEEIHSVLFLEDTTLDFAAESVLEPSAPRFGLFARAGSSLRYLLR